jgi:hypothetical protein
VELSSRRVKFFVESVEISKRFWARLPAGIVIPSVGIFVVFDVCAIKGSRVSQS